MISYLVSAILSITAVILWYLFGPVVRKSMPVRTTTVSNNSTWKHLDTIAVCATAPTPTPTPPTPHSTPSVPDANQEQQKLSATLLASKLKPIEQPELKDKKERKQQDENPTQQNRSEVSNFGSIEEVNESDIYRNKRGQDHLLVSPFESTDPKIQTLDAMFRFAAQKYAVRKLFGTRSVVLHEEVKEAETDKDGNKKEKIVKIPHKKEYEFITYEAATVEISRVGAGLAKLGLTKGDLVGIYATTRREWQMAAQACFAHALPIVTMYPTLGVESLISVLEETELTVAVVDGSGVIKVLEANKQTRSLKCVIHLDRFSEKDDQLVNQTNVKIISYDDLLELGISKQPPVTPPSPRDIALIMYTSGSTGKPKGVLLSHENMMASIAGLKEIITSPLTPINEEDVLLSYLPLAHVLELAAELTVISCGGAIGFSDPRSIRREQVRDVETKRYKSDAEALAPTLMTMVPAIAERIRTAIKYSLKRQFWWNRVIFNVCYYLKRRNYLRGKSSPLIDGLVFNKVYDRFGGRLRGVLSGGAAMSLQLLEFANICFCCPVVQAYGLTETCGAGTCTDLNDIADDSVGVPIACCEIKLIERKEMGYFLHTPQEMMRSDVERKSPVSSVTRFIKSNTRYLKGHYLEQYGPRGEICIRGKNVAEGYFKRPELTAKSFIDVGDGQGKWFLTGDIGEWLPNGHLRVIDRTKDLIKLSNGEYIALSQLERVYKATPMVQWISIYVSLECDRLFGIVVPDLQKFQIKHGKKATQEVKKTIMDSLLKRGEKANLKKYEMLSDIVVVDDNWSIESGLITEAGKIKRHEIYQKYKKEIKEMESKYQKHRQTQHEAQLINREDLKSEPKAQEDVRINDPTQPQTLQQPMQAPSIPPCNEQHPSSKSESEHHHLKNKLKLRNKHKAEQVAVDELSQPSKFETSKNTIKGA